MWLLARLYTNTQTAAQKGNKSPAGGTANAAGAKLEKCKRGL